MKSLVIIPARGGSRGLPNKNIKELNGKPLIHYTIEAARNVFDDSSIYVSTDSKKIKKIAEATGLKIPFLRPKNLAKDTSNIRDVILHAIEFYKLKNNEYPNFIVLLQPTSPLRNSNHIIEAIDLYNDKLDMVSSVNETNANPYYVLFEENKEGLLKKVKKANFTRRQDCPKVWQYNGAVYIINTKSIIKKEFHKFSKIKKYVMSLSESIDIDNYIDFELCKIIMNENR